MHKPKDPLDLDACILLLPFLDIVRSGDTSGPITSVALNAIDQFITLQLIHPHSPSLAQALQQLSEAATHCKFEASDTVSDELVLAKIQDVLVHTLTGPLGPFLTDEAVCSMMETVLGMCCQMRLSGQFPLRHAHSQLMSRMIRAEMLRKTSEKTMQCLTRTVLERLQFVETPTRAAPSHNTQFSISAPDPASMKLPVLSQLAPSPVSPDQDMRPYGLPSITELLRVLIDLLDPRDHNHTDAMRLLSVNLLSTVFQVAGTSIGRFPSLRNMVTDRLCKFLLQLASSASINNSQHQVMITAASLRLWTHLLDTLRPHLKLQQELLVSFLMDRLAIVPGKEQEQELDRRTWDATSNDLNPMPTASPANPLASSVNHRQTPDRSTSNSPTPSMLRARALEAQNASLSPEIRALLLEHLCLLAREPDTPLMLWQNYDCQLESEDLWQRLVRFFSRGVYPTASHALLPTGAAAATLAQQQSMQDATQLMCLDTVLTFVSFMAERTEADQKLSSQRVSLSTNFCKK